MQCHNDSVDSNTLLECDLVPQEYMPYIKSREDEVLKVFSNTTWACTHCAEYLAGRDQGDKDNVWEHVKDSYVHEYLQFQR